MPATGSLPSSWLLTCSKSFLVRFPRVSFTERSSLRTLLRKGVLEVSGPLEEKAFLIAAEVLPEVEVLFGAAVPLGEKDLFGASAFLGDEVLFDPVAGPLEEKPFFGPEEVPLGEKDFLGPANVPFGAKLFLGPAEEDFLGENERLPVAEEGLFDEDGFLVLEAALPVFSDLAIILPVYSTKIGRLKYFSYFYGSKS